jgi:N-acetylglutamate synthase-like GNAT family acetyltransferase
VILFVKHPQLGSIETYARSKTGDRQFEQTKMGVTEAARGRQKGGFLLNAAIIRARKLAANPLYLLNNRACAAATHLCEELGFVHRAGIMERFGRRYARCEMAMLHVSKAENQSQ